MPDNPASSSRNLAIKSNPLKNTKKPEGDERKKVEIPIRKFLNKPALFSLTQDK